MNAEIALSAVVGPGRLVDVADLAVCRVLGPRGKCGGLAWVRKPAADVASEGQGDGQLEKKKEEKT